MDKLLDIKKLLYIVSIIFYFTLINAEAQVFEPSVVISKMQSHFENIKGFRALFIEKNGDKTSRGEILYKTPGKFRMKYTSPNEGSQTISFNGEYLWIYIPKSRIVSEQKIDTNENLGGLYTKNGVSRLTSDYNFNFYKNTRKLEPLSKFDGSMIGISEDDENHAKDDKRMAYHMELTPKKASTDKTGFIKIHLWVGENGMIFRAIGISTTQSIIEYFFYGIDYREVYSDDAFNFVIPQGVLVLKDKLVD